MEQIMRREDVLGILTEHRTELNHAGVRTLACFGSIARDEARPDSDIDLLVEFVGRPSFARYMDLKSLLEDLLGRRVDLVTPKAIKPKMRAGIEREMIRVPGL
jgi:predicted nucleotidyltransferase